MAVGLSVSVCVIDYTTRVTEDTDFFTTVSQFSTDDSHYPFVDIFIVHGVSLFLLSP